MCFQLNLQTQTLILTKDNYSLVIPERWKFFYFNSLGFILDPDQPKHQILFSVYKERVQVLYKFPQLDGSVIRYKREIYRPLSGVIEIEFSEWDRLEKKKICQKQ